MPTSRNGRRLALVTWEITDMEPDECRWLALLYRDQAEIASGSEREGLLAMAAHLEEMADDEDGGPSRTIH